MERRPAAAWPAGWWDHRARAAATRPDRRGGAGAARWRLRGHLGARRPDPRRAHGAAARGGDAAFPELDAAQVTLGDTLAGQWLVELPSFALRSVPEGRQLFGRIADGRWLTRSALFGPWLLRDLETGAETPVADRKGWVFGDHTGHLDLLDTSGYINYRSVRRLLRFPYDLSLIHISDPTRPY